MKIFFNTINFGNNKPRIVENKDSSGNTRRVEYDTFGHDVDSKLFDRNGIVSEHQHKVYYEKDNEKGCIEFFKNKFQEYTRRTYTKTENGFKYSVDDFKSKTRPEANYINEFIYDLSNKLIKIINNGKVIKL